MLWTELRSIYSYCQLLIQSDVGIVCSIWFSMNRTSTRIWAIPCVVNVVMSNGMVPQESTCSEFPYMSRSDVKSTSHGSINELRMHILCPPQHRSHQSLCVGQSTKRGSKCL